MKKIMVMAGSNSKESINRVLARYAYSQMGQCDAVEVDLSQIEVPLYSPDLEKKEGIPDVVERMNKHIESVDGIILSLAEYNGSYSSAFKNIFDWLSRIDTKVWKEKPMLLMATSPGKRGGAGVLGAAKASFPHLGGNIVAEFSLPSFQSNFDGNEISDEGLRSELASQVSLLQERI